ncbi:unnamed protein product [Ilex paraguariensis]|uniref:Uncharacterized protein n=1 Tax=Ilex paraguariensis TaxID=185542 RepID=A0ABC8T465_9AQUA
MAHLSVGRPITPWATRRPLHLTCITSLHVTQTPLTKTTHRDSEFLSVEITDGWSSTTHSNLSGTSVSAHSGEDVDSGVEEIDDGFQEVTARSSRWH